MTSVLRSRQHTVSSDPVAFTDFAVANGWGDGLPLIPPTPERVAEFVAAAGHPADHVVGKLPPLNGAATIEKIAINAVMAGAPAPAMPLIVTAIGAMTEPDFELHAQNATTASVVPAILVNGPVRHRLNISFGAGCVGGADGGNPAIGRAIRLALRNIGAHRVGVTSQSVYGQPGRVAGIVFGEWEERSPWAPLAERRGVSGDAVTVFAAMGTMNIVDAGLADTADLLIDHIGRSMAYPGANGYLPGLAFSEVLIGINPVWAEIIGRKYPNVVDVEDRIWDAASLPLSEWPAEYHQSLEKTGNVHVPGRAHLMKDRDNRVHVTVCGGLGALHALGLHGFGPARTITASI